VGATRSEDKEARESAASSEGFEDGREDEEREASESATLNEGRETRDDFLEVVESDGLCGGSGARFPCADNLVGLILVIGGWGTYFVTVVMWRI
jgi:hypothetical protein